MENELKQLGLTPNEIKIYNALLEIGESTVGPLIKKLGMHRQVAYDSLKGLQEKNMVLSTTKNNRLYFRIANPQNILDSIKQKERVAKNLIEEIGKRIEGKTRKQEIKVYEGIEAYGKLVIRKDNLTPNGYENSVVSGAGTRYKEIMTKAGVFEKSNKIRSKKNISTRFIYSGITNEEAHNIKRANSQFRILPEGYASPTSFVIWYDSITLGSYGTEDSDVFCIEIKNDDFRKAYINYFNLLWKIAKK